MLEGRYRRHLVALSIIVVCMAFISYAVVLATRSVPIAEDPPAVASATLHVGSIAPNDYVLHRLSGTTSASLAGLIHGRPAVVNFFASWCPACAAELAAFAKVSKLDGNRVSFVGVDTSEPAPGTSRALLRKVGADYPVVLDENNVTVATAYGIDHLPVTFFLDSDGHVVSDALGRLTAAQLERRVQALVAHT